MNNKTDLQKNLKKEQTAHLNSQKLLKKTAKELFLANQKLNKQLELTAQHTKKIELFLSITEMVNGSLEFKKQLKFFIRSICEMSGWPIGHVYQPHSSQENTVYPTKIWYFKGKIPQKFKIVTEKTILKKGQGLPGHVYKTQKPYWIRDIDKAIHFSRKKALKGSNIKSAFAIPIVVENKVAAICEFFCPTILKQDTYLLKIIKAAAEQLAFSIQQKQKQVQHQKELQYQVTHDNLTGLPNRLLLIDRIEQAIKDASRNQKKVAVVFIDLDYFKNVNDEFGHDVGDKLLKLVANRLNKTIRASDTLARLSGDEFVLMLPNLDKITSTPPLLKKIISTISKPYLIKKKQIHITCSVGLSIYPEDGLDPQKLLKNSDAAMYKAKETGRNNYHFFTSDMNTKILERLTLEKELVFALEKNEMSVVYQPKFNFESNSIIGMEALIRWESPTLGLVLPTDFLPVAEQIGLTLPLGNWVLKTACAQNKAWQEAGFPPIIVSINLAVKQFKDPNFVKNVKEILKETKLEPTYLELELTENLAMDNPKEFTQKLYELKKIGVKLSIDDFGAGYSSLSYLHQFPVDWLKIDPALIKTLSTNNQRNIVNAIISLGKNLNMKIIAEGVETSKQFKELKKHGCDEVQGYYISRPLTSIEFSEFLKEKTKKQKT